MDFKITISSIVFIIVLIVPGVLFKRFYFQGQFSKQFGSGLFADRIITTIFLGVFVQISTFLIFNKWLDLSYDKIRKPISDVYTEFATGRLPDFTPENLRYSLIYLIVSLILASLYGSICHALVRILKLDIKLHTLRFTNHWNYYFKGEILSTKDFKSLRTGKVLSTLVDVLADNSDEKPLLYSGTLTQYTINANSGELESIYLTNASRYSKTKEDGPGFKEIPGDCLIIPYSRIINMNIRYIKHPIAGKQWFKDFVFPIISLTILLSVLIGPWFLTTEISLFRTFVGVIVSFFDWSILVAIIGSFYDPNSKLQKRGFFWAIITFILLSFIALYIFKVITINNMGQFISRLY